MPLPLPTTLTPSKVSAFTSCPLAFRYSVIDRLPEPPSAEAVKGTLVHSTLQALFSGHDAGSRSRAAAGAALETAFAAMKEDPEFIALGLTPEAVESFGADAETLLDGYFRLEDPDRVNAIGLELDLRADLDGIVMRGIIDRLDLLPSGDLVVVDYKTGRSPSVDHSRKRMAGVHFYAWLCEQIIGVRPVEIRLMYLRDSVSVSTETSEQLMRGLRQRSAAVWQAIIRACEHDDFRPHPSALCKWCSFTDYCPAVGGDPGLVPAAPDPVAALAAEVASPISAVPLAAVPVSAAPALG
ncbi:MAG TPA: PD-(D/E)XK nuclease family protein [Acidimicrobiales bacterium]|nr:PD-(D/E)XK nuclease family protein [Acidimicrobiales bacterium]